ncbi:MAG TPA: metallophosphoesterase [Tepidisphaeraceae bacterium]
MGFVLIIISAMLLADVCWWFYTDRLARRWRLPAAWRVGLGVWMGLLIAGLGLLVVARLLRLRINVMPETAYSILLSWHLLVLPVLLLLLLALAVARRVVRRERAPVAELPVDVGRRAFLTHALVAAPPIVTLVLTGKAAIDRDEFTVRRAMVPLRALPRGLDGMTVAFVSDPHVGSFMSDRKFNAIIESTNALDADLVLHGGDLINSNLVDLPDGIDLLRRLRGRYGTFSCQGNHDCIESRAIFESRTTQADVGMLLDEIRTIRVRGHDVQVIAPRWARGRDDRAIHAAADRIVAQRRPDLFSVLLAHHPHNFDIAAARGVPLTLVGHTHGGQIGFSPRYSFGRFMYRYHSGEYRIGDSACSVSNGIGNWFPLRVNVPPEIVHLTLTCA